MDIKIEKNFVGSTGIPLTLYSMNNRNPEDEAKRFFKTGFKENDNFVIKDNGNYRGINFMWQVMINAKPEDVRKFFKNSVGFGCTDNFRADKRNVLQNGISIWKWNPNMKMMLTEFVREDIVKLLQKGIELEINGRYGLIGTYEGIYHFVGMEWIKTAYIQCYNEDNGIKEACFITTAICNSFGKSDDCFELTAFRKFRDTWLVAQPDGKTLIAEYYAIAPRIVENINHLVNAKKIYETIWQKYLAPCLKFIERGDNLSCKQKYIEMVRDLKGRYL